MTDDGPAMLFIFYLTTLVFAGGYFLPQYTSLWLAAFGSGCGIVAFAAWRQGNEHSGGEDGAE